MSEAPILKCLRRRGPTALVGQKPLVGQLTEVRERHSFVSAIHYPSCHDVALCDA